MAKKGVLLLNMGGPDSIEAIKPFLFNLFSDPYIVNLDILQKPLAWFISNLRAKKVKKAYKLIGGKSPIKEITISQALELESILGQDFKVKVGMNYWHPFIDEALHEFERERIKNLIALSLYPQYCHSTSASAIEKFKQFASDRFEYKIISSWYDNPFYIDAWVESITKTLNMYGNGYVLFSAHGIPLSLYKLGDPYISQTEKTVNLIVEKLKLNDWIICYQSRTGPVKWVGPSTEQTIKKLAGEGIKRIFIVPVSFVSDNIETLYEIDFVYSSTAQKLGVQLIRVPSLNTEPKFIEALRHLVLKYTD